MIADILNSGFEGIPISYSPRTDDAIALTLLASCSSIIFMIHVRC